MDNLDLEGRRILIVEDDFFVALDLKQVLDEAGCTVVGTASSVERALTTISGRRIDAALLDVTLERELVFAVADRLSADGVPFVFITCDPTAMPERHWMRPVISKPYQPPEVLAALAAVMRPG